MIFCSPKKRPKTYEINFTFQEKCWGFFQMKDNALVQQLPFVVINDSIL